MRVGPRRRHRRQRVEEQKTLLFSCAGGKKNRKHSNWRKKWEQTQNHAPSRGRFHRTGTVDSFTGGRGNTAHREKEQINNSLQKSLNGANGTTLCTRSKRNDPAGASSGTSLKKAPDDGIRNWCAEVEARNGCAVAEATESGALQGLWEGGETPT